MSSFSGRNLTAPLPALELGLQAALRQNAGLFPTLPSSAADWAKVAGIMPVAAADFVNDRYYGGASLIDIATVRSAGTHQWKDSAGNVLQFAANQVRRSDLGLYLDANDTCTLSGVLAALIQANATTGFTLLAEFGVSEVVEGTYDVTTGPNNQTLIGGANSGAQFLGRGGNGALAKMWNGSVQITGQSNSPGNGRSFDTATQAVAISCDASGNRAISLGGGAPGTGTGGIGSVTTIYLGKEGGGTQSTGMIIRSLRAWVGALTAAQLQQISFYPPTERFHIPIGDSLAAGAGATVPSSTSWFARLNNRFNPDAYSGLGTLGNGGDTSKQALDRFNGITNGSGAPVTDPVRLRERVWSFWTGHNDPDAAATLAALRAMVDQLTGEKRYLIILPLQSTANAVGSAGYQKILDIRTLIRANFPAFRIVDAPAALAAAAPNDANVASGYTPSIYLGDTIHPNDAGQAVIEPAVYAAWIANGW